MLLLIARALCQVHAVPFLLTPCLTVVAISLVVVVLWMQILKPESAKFDFLQKSIPCEQLDHCRVKLATYAGQSSCSSVTCIACHWVASFVAMSKKRFRPLGDIIRMGLVDDGALLRYVVGLLSLSHFSRL